MDPAYTSRRCSQCHHRDRRNRPSRSEFACGSCGVSMHTDHNASRNIAHKGAAAWTAGRESRVPEPA
ncbi:zinc ribbon domain-containing protein [Kitasatospora sp. NPDC050543]|uniref:zinc ribbon domain-containing protein n=1 Tax=Kitasatospora sp. NPDC050543 TaxID=3364054 RepID=UPI003797AC03